jgi:AmmeMemoRadiSam system protein A
MVPLYFLRKYYQGGKILRIGLSGLPLTEHYYFGTLIRSAIEALGRRAVVIASGDLSHKLQEYGPYGFDPAGPLYDRRIMEDAGSGNFEAFFDYDEEFLSSAAECGHRSFVIMAGILDGLKVKAEALSHQDVTGVGYGICTFQVENDLEIREDRRFLKLYESRKTKELAGQGGEADPYVILARETIRRHLEGRELPTEPEEVLEGMLEYADEQFGLHDYTEVLSGLQDSLEESTEVLSERNLSSEDLAVLRKSLEALRLNKAGVFVSIHENGTLRGCIGTILPTTSSVYEEILQNAVSAASKDPRFAPIRLREFPYLEINVDVLFAPELVTSVEELDPKKYGIIVSSKGRKGLLLPDLEGVDTVEDQIAIARQKAGIGPEEPISLQRFTVTRHK